LPPEALGGGLGLLRGDAGPPKDRQVHIYKKKLFFCKTSCTLKGGNC
jgi:hypothetical protein